MNLLLNWLWSFVRAVQAEIEDARAKDKLLYEQMKRIWKDEKAA